MNLLFLIKRKFRSALQSRLPVLVIGALLLSLQACGSGSNMADDAGLPETSNSDPVVTSATNSETEPATPASEPADEDTGDTAEQTAESTPVQLLLDEIRLTALAPVLELNAKLQSGVELNGDEAACSSDFDPAAGRQLTAIDCTNPLNVYNSKIQLSTASFGDTDSCQQALLNASGEQCQLEQSTFTLPIEWVQGPDSSPSQIGTATPIAGAIVNYNSSLDQILTLEPSSSVTAPFFCEINLATASIIDNDSQIGNCQQEVDHLLGRLFELRQAALNAG